MFTRRQLCFGLLFIILASGSAAAQNQAPAGTRGSSPEFNIIISRRSVRFASPTEVREWRVEVYSQTGELVFASGNQSGTELEWSLLDQNDKPVESGLYAYTLTIKDQTGEGSRVQRGHVIVDRASAADRVWVTSDQAASVGTGSEGGKLTVAGTSETTVGGAELPARTRQRPGEAAPNSARKDQSERSESGDKSAVQATAATANRLARFTDAGGTLGDSLLQESGTNIVHNGNSIQLTAPASSLFDTNLLYLDSPAKTTGVLAGSTPAFLAANGPYFAMRGNTYSALGGQRGLFALSAGNVSSPAGNEGSMLFLTGADQLRMIIKPNGRVGIGAPTPGTQLEVVSPGSLTSVHGRAGGPGPLSPGTGAGVWGESDSGNGLFGTSNSGFGVYGFSLSGTAMHGENGNGNKADLGTPADGVFGQALSMNGNGLHGVANNGPFSNGVLGASTNGNGVTGSSGNGTGVFGTAGSFGVYGNTNSTSADLAGVFGTSTSGSATGVMGIINGSGAGVIGKSTSGYGVVGASSSSIGVSGSGGGYGVVGATSSSGYAGVYGIGVDGSPGVWGQNSGSNTGVHGIVTNSSSLSSGVYGKSDNGTGVKGTSSSGFAMRAEGNAQQSRDKGGWVKAMVRYNNSGTICFRGDGNANGLTANSCSGNFTIAGAGTGEVTITFPFTVNDRFIVVSTQYGGISDIVTAAYEFAASNQIVVRTFRNGQFDNLGFTLAVL